MAMPKEVNNHKQESDSDQDGWMLEEPFGSMLNMSRKCTCFRADKFIEEGQDVMLENFQDQGERGRATYIDQIRLTSRVQAFQNGVHGVPSSLQRRRSHAECLEIRSAT